jgi:hypothetical protein
MLKYRHATYSAAAVYDRRREGEDLTLYRPAVMTAATESSAGAHFSF